MSLYSMKHHAGKHTTRQSPPLCEVYSSVVILWPILNLVGHLSHCRFSHTVLCNVYILKCQVTCTYYGVRQHLHITVLGNMHILRCQVICIMYVGMTVLGNMHVLFVKIKMELNQTKQHTKIDNGKIFIYIQFVQTTNIIG